MVNERYLFFYGSEWVLLRFKCKFFFESNDDDEKLFKDCKKCKRKKYCWVFYGYVKMGRVFWLNLVLFFFNEFVRGNYLRSMVWKWLGLIRNFFNMVFVKNNNVIF